MNTAFTTALLSLTLASSLLAAPPVNDNKTNATVLTGANVVVNADCAEATFESGDFAQKTVWWQWTAPASGTVVIDTVGSAAPYLALQVWLKESSGAVSGRIAYDDGDQFGTSYRPSVGFSVVQGTTYLIGTGTVNTSSTTGLRLALILNTSSVIGGMTFSQPVTMANDLFSQRITLTGNTAASMAYNYSASIEAGEPAKAGIRTFWWSYTPTANGRLSLTTVNSDVISKNLAIYIGTAVNSLKLLEDSSTGYGSENLSITLPVTAGTTYQISLGSYQDEIDSGALILSLALDTQSDVSGLNIPNASTPYNDSFSSRVTLSGTLVSGIGYGRPASIEAGEPSSLGSNTLWWTYRPTSDGRLTITTDGSSGFRKNVGVYLGGSVSALREVAFSSSQSSSNNNPVFSFPVTADTDYQIAVGSYYNYELGHVVITLNMDAAADVTDLNITNPATIQNDAFAQRVLLTGKEVSAIGYTASATNEIGEPAASGARSLWWTYTPPTAGRLIISTQGSDNFSKTVAVYLGSNLTGLRLVANVVANQYNSSTGNVVSFSLPVTANTDYQVSLGNIDSYEAGDAAVISFSLDDDTDINDLNLGAPAAAANDLFASSTVLSGEVVSGIGYATGAVREALEPATTKERTLWWSWTAPNNGLAMVDTTGSDTSSGGSTIEKWVSVWTGSSLSGLSQVALSTRSTTPSVLFEITAGQVYRIAVGNNTNTALPTSSVVMSIVSAPSSPVLAAPLVSRLVRLNEAIVLNASASGLGIAWQWTKNASVISGATSATYAKTFGSLNDAGVYAVAVAGPGGTSTSTANIGIVSAAATPVSVNEGENMEITVSAAGPGLTYQWYRDGVILVPGDPRITGINSAKLSITGLTALDASVYHCAVSMPDALNPGVLTLNSGNFTVNGVFKPVSVGGGPYVWQVGRQVSLTIATRFNATSLKITGLPKGLTYNPVNGQITGIPEVAIASSTFKVTASNDLGSGPERGYAFSVLGFDTDGLGIFNGLVTHSSTFTDAKYGGSLNLVVASSGFYTGTLRLGTASHSLKGRLIDGGADVATTLISITRTGKNPLTLDLDINLSNGHLTGTLGDGSQLTSVEAWRSIWTKTITPGTLATTYTAALAPHEAGVGETPDYPLGDGVSFISISTLGVVTWKGTLADGTTITGSTTMGPGGQIPLHVMLYTAAAPGSITGWTTATQPISGDPLLDGSARWSKSRQSTGSMAYRDGFAPHDLTVIGGKFIKPTSIILGMADQAGNARITFAEGGLATPISTTFQISALNKPVLIEVTTPAKLAMTLNVTSPTNLGLISGSFEIAEAPPSKVKRTVKYTGAIVNRLEVGTGHFLLAQLPGIATSPLLSGWMELQGVE
jgi:hypothetical protein